MDNDKDNTYTFYATNVDFGDGVFKLTGLDKVKLVFENDCKPNPNAPKDIEGSYTLTVNGRTVTLSDGKDKVEATCYYEDNFDIGEGVRQCFEKLKEARKEIKVGDMVEITNWLKCYDTYPEWLYNKIDFKYVKQYDYLGSMNNGDCAKVIAIGPLSDNDQTTVYAVESKVNGKVYLFNRDGLLRKGKVVD